ncbi:diguanylate cyclase [Thiomicrospira aerophila AL3]|uniref:diguanylate cyclase n=1 Tax=Thiomicrospira aerophila AL3 TaxID=717772 RepID=W0DYX2_9GAMM|nr:transporter substrate-binding domain-containing protein [Thiomicrospira aerophila]AHF02061.1 diguanylate cyclase [Thiomicrospira aerophila AL3]
MYIKKLTNLWVFLGLLFGAVVAIAEEQAPIKSVSVQVNWHHQYQFAGFYAALAQGYYRDEGLDVTIKDWRPGLDIVDEVVSGRATFGTAYSSAVVDFIHGAPIAAVMTSFQFSPMVLLSKEPITHLSQLSGKTVSHYNNLQILALLNRAEQDLTAPLITIPPSGDLNDFINKKIDLYGAYETNEPYQLKEHNLSYHLVKPADFGVNSMEDIVIVAQKFADRYPDVVERFRRATVAGWRYAIDNQPEVVAFIMQNYPVVKSEQALVYEAQATTKYVRVGRIPIGAIDASRVLATAAEARDIGLITDSLFNQFSPKAFIFNSTGLGSLTEEERAFLHQNPVIRIGNDINWAPFEFIDAKGQYAGMVADYFRLFEQRLGVRFEPQKNTTWSETLSKVQQGEIHLLSGATPTPERLEYLKFTQPYLTFPMVLAGNPDTFFINHYQELEGKTVAVVRDYWSHEYLQNNYPQVNLYLVDSVLEGLQAVMSGKAFVYSGNLAVINYIMRQQGITGMQIVGQSDQRFELAIGVPRDNPLLFSIMQKALDDITLDEHNAIYAKWVNLSLLTRLDNRQLFQLLIYGLLIAFALIAWIVVYRVQKQQLKVFLSQVNELSYASHIDPHTYKIVWASDSYTKLTGYSSSELAELSILDLMRVKMSEDELAMIVNQVMKGDSWTGEIEGQSKQGVSYWVEITLSPQRNLFGKVEKLLATRVNITDKKRLETQSIEDELTGLYNRRYLLQLFDKELGRLKRLNHTLCLAVFDLDYFKLINDTYGHEQGDQVLQQISMLSKVYFGRANDYVFRLGGEEFLIMTSNQSSTVFMEQLEKFRLAIITARIPNESTELGWLSLSLGAGVWASDSISAFKDVYRDLDNALYLAKNLGRNKLVMIDEDTQAQPST